MYALIPNKIKQFGTSLKRFVFYGDLKGTADNATNDDKGNKISETYLPLSGGALNGTYIARNVDNSKLVLYGGNGYHHGAQINIHGLDLENEKGAVNIETYNGSTSAILKLLSDGTLTWNGYDLAGNSIVAQSIIGANGYIKYANRLIFQFGKINITSSTGKVTVQLPISFSDLNTKTFCTFQNANVGTNNTISSIGSKTTIDIYVPTGAVGGTIAWFAIGY